MPLKEVVHMVYFLPCCSGEYGIILHLIRVFCTLSVRFQHINLLIMGKNNLELGLQFINAAELPTLCCFHTHPEVNDLINKITQNFSVLLQSITIFLVLFR